MMSTMRHRTSSLVALLAALLVIVVGAGQLIITKMPGRSFRGPLAALSAEQIDLEERLRAHVETLAARMGERNLFRHSALTRAAQYIDDTLAAEGHRSQSQEFYVQGKPVRNIEVELTGAEPSRAIVLVGAHYDSVAGSPGANDNGTGVAAVLELARALKGRRLRHSVRLVAFVNEESPFFYSDAMGSLRYANRMADRSEDLVAMLSLETIGYYSDDRGSQRYPFPLGFFYPEYRKFHRLCGQPALENTGTPGRAELS